MLVLPIAVFSPEVTCFHSCVLNLEPWPLSCGRGNYKFIEALGSIFLRLIAGRCWRRVQHFVKSEMIHEFMEREIGEEIWFPEALAAKLTVADLTGEVMTGMKNIPAKSVDGAPIALGAEAALRWVKIDSLALMYTAGRTLIHLWLQL